MIEKTYSWADKCLADVEVYLLRLSEEKVLSEEETAERDFAWNELVAVEKMFRDCRNELCERCGSYKNEYGEIWCDNCRWR